MPAWALAVAGLADMVSQVKGREHAMDWFVTWDVPEYREWAHKADYGYLLLIINKESQGFRCAKARLLFQDAGLPAFDLLSETVVETDDDAEGLIKGWM
jgi:hypothetical protein